MSSKIKFIIFSVVLISIFFYLDDDHSKKIDASKFNKESEKGYVTIEEFVAIWHAVKYSY